MTIKDLDNNIHNWHLTGNMSHGNTANKSSLHLRVRQILTRVGQRGQELDNSWT